VRLRTEILGAFAYSQSLADFRHKRQATYITGRRQVNSIFQVRRGLRLRTAAGIGGALMIAACASTPAPTAQLQAAEQAISNADRAEAGRYAATEMGDARTKLASANTAVQEKRMVEAARLADQSLVEAQLASARTASVKAKAVNDEMKTSTGTLVDEMQRNSGEQK
jgi:hypothetical protein